MDLNDFYRQEGWGKITDQAFKGCLKPADVESQARTVAQWAYERITELNKKIVALEAERGTT